LIVNVQGDEPLIDPDSIDRAIEPFGDDPSLSMTTLRVPITDAADYDDPNGGYVGGIFAYPVFELFQRDTSVVTTVIGYQGAGQLHLAVKTQAEIINGEYVSGNYFSGLGVSPASGRLIAPDDDRAGAAGVAVISYALSEASFGGAANAPGQSVLLDNIPFTVVGVTPPGFFGADPNVLPAVYVPMHANLLLQAGKEYARAAERYTDPNFDWVVPMARLRPGVTAAQAQAALGPSIPRGRRRPTPSVPRTICRRSSSRRARADSMVCAARTRSRCICSSASSD